MLTLVSIFASALNEFKNNGLTKIFKITDNNLEMQQMKRNKWAHDFLVILQICKR